MKTLQRRIALALVFFHFAIALATGSAAWSKPHRDATIDVALVGAQIAKLPDAAGEIARPKHVAHFVATLPTLQASLVAPFTYEGIASDEIVSAIELDRDVHHARGPPFRS